MNNEPLTIGFTENDKNQRMLSVGEQQAATAAELVALVPDLARPESLPQYCAAVNYLAQGFRYRLIDDPDAYRTRYQRRLQAEDPLAPFQQGVLRLSDFGVCDTSAIQRPSRHNGAVIFYVEDDVLGIPYRVTAPGPEHPEGEAEYEPLPMSPLPTPPPPAQGEEWPEPVDVEEVAGAIDDWTTEGMPAETEEEEKPLALEPDRRPGEA
jgi:hypothetical protein